MGTPVRGGPKYTAAGDYLAGRGVDLDWAERESVRRESTPITRPITAIVSRSDGIVGYAAAIDGTSASIEHVDVDASHLGMVFKPQIWNITLDAIDKALKENP